MVKIMNPQLRIRELEHEVRKLQAENTRLRKQAQETNRHARRVMQAFEDAMKLGALHVSFQSTSREACSELGITQRRWENARALLKLAGVMTPRLWKVHDIREIEARLEMARSRALDSQKLFENRLPRNVLTDNRKHQPKQEEAQNGHYPATSPRISEAAAQAAAFSSPRPARSSGEAGEGRRRVQRIGDTTWPGE